MNPRCKPCLGRDIKAAILKEVTDQAVVSLLERVPDCAEATAIDLCGKASRAKSERQLFMSSCLKGKHIKGFADAPRAMRECSIEWREKGQ